MFNDITSEFQKATVNNLYIYVTVIHYNFDISSSMIHRNAYLEFLLGCYFIL